MMFLFLYLHRALMAALSRTKSLKSMILLPVVHLYTWLVRMKRLVGFVLVVAGLSGNGVHAQSDSPSQQGRSVVAVTSSAGDARLGLVDEAVSFWNKTLQEIGVCYSLGPVTRLVQSVPEEALQSVGQLLEGGRGPSKIPPVLLDQSGDITIFLAESEFLSFAVGPLGPEGGAGSSWAQISAPDAAERRAQRHHTPARYCIGLATQQRSYDADVWPPGAMPARVVPFIYATCISAD
jgi:hypothetical protein